MKLKSDENVRDEGRVQKTEDDKSVRTYRLPFNASLDILSRRR